MGEIFIVQVHPADGWGEDYFYCYHYLDNAREKIRQLAETCELELLNPDFAARFGDFDRDHRIKEVALSEEWFED